MKLTIYGDFNCPYSYLASVRGDALAAAGIAEIEWRPVEHDADIVTPTRALSADDEAMLDREITEIRGLLGTDEHLNLQRPPLLPNSAAAIQRFASAAPSEADEVRRRLFNALWADGRDIADKGVLDALVGKHRTGGERAEQWQDEWMAFDKRLVPMLVLDDGTLSRGLGALKRLAEFARAERAATGC